MQADEVAVAFSAAWRAVAMALRVAVAGDSVAVPVAVGSGVAVGVAEAVAVGLEVQVAVGVSVGVGAKAIAVVRPRQPHTIAASPPPNVIQNGRGGLIGAPRPAQQRPVDRPRPGSIPVICAPSATRGTRQHPGVADTCETPHTSRYGQASAA